MKKIIVILFTAGLCIGLLLGVNSLTRTRINDQAVAEVKTYLEKYFPNASEYKEVTNEDTSGLVVNVYQATNAGFAYKIITQGYNSNVAITFIIGIDNEGTIAGLDYLSISETDGIGMKVTGSDFLDGVVGKTTSDSYPLISGATVSSTAVVNGINAARVLFNAQAGIETDSETSAPPTVESEKLIISEAAGQAEADAAESSVAGSVYTVVVRANGYHANNDGGKPNKFEIVIDADTKTITSVKVTVFNDTAGIGDKIEDTEFLDQFAGLSIEDSNAGVDVASGATESSNSAVAAVKAAIAYVLGQ